MVVVPRLERLVFGQGLDDARQAGIEVRPMPAPGLPLVVALELAGTAIAKITGVSRTSLYSFMSTRGLKPSP